MRRAEGWLAAALILLLASCATHQKREVRYNEPEPADCVPFCATIRGCAAKAGHKELGETLCKIARCETGSKCTPRIDSPNGLYHGAFQFTKQTWNSLCRPFFIREGLSECRGNAAMYDTCCSAMCSADIISKGGIGNWPTCGKKARM